MLKKLLVTICLVLALSLALGACSPTATASDEAANTLYSLGLFQGTGSDSQGNPVFELGRAPTRAEAVTMLVRLLGADLKSENPLPFTDVPNWAKPYVSYAFSNGLTNGTGPSAFGSNDAASATQYLSFVLRALGYSSGSDFRWDAAWELSDALGLTHGEYRAGCSFTRGDVASISLSALYQPVSGSGETLAARLCASGAIKDEALARKLLGDAAFTPAAALSPLELHFIDVGQADSILVRCGSHAMLVDGGNVADSSLLYSYLKDLDVTALDCVVGTHAHEDHIGGLAGALNFATTKKALCPVTSYDSEAFKNFKAALAKQGVAITVPEAGDSFSLGDAAVTVLAAGGDGGEVNNTSIVLRIDHGERSFLLMGDAELESETKILDSGKNVDVDLIKIGHHGSESSTGYRLLYEASPQYAVISCGQNNSYGHPDEAVMSRLRDAGVKVCRTDMQGHIVCRSDGHTLTVSTERNAQADTNPKPSGGETAASSYIGNINSKIFHLSTCASLPLEKNRFYFGTRQEAVSAGYTPCSKCKP